MSVDLESIIIQECQEKQEDALSSRANQDLINELSKYNKHLTDISSAFNSAVSLAGMGLSLPSALPENVLNSTNSSADFQAKKDAYSVAGNSINAVMGALTGAVINNPSSTPANIEKAKSLKESLEDSKILK